MFSFTTDLKKIKLDPCRAVFRTHSSIYDGVFFAKIVND